MDDFALRIRAHERFWIRVQVRLEAATRCRRDTRRFGNSLVAAFRDLDYRPQTGSNRLERDPSFPAAGSALVTLTAIGSPADDRSLDLAPALDEDPGFPSFTRAGFW